MCCIQQLRNLDGLPRLFFLVCNLKKFVHMVYFCCSGPLLDSRRWIVGRKDMPSPIGQVDDGGEIWLRQSLPLATFLNESMLVGLLQWLGISAILKCRSMIRLTRCLIEVTASSRYGRLIFSRDVFFDTD